MAGPDDARRANEARLASGMGQVPQTAFAQMSAYNQTPLYTNPQDPFVALTQISDPARKAQMLQDIARTYSNLPGPEGYSGNQFNYIQEMMRKSGLSKSTTPLGIFGIDEGAVFEKVVLASMQSNLDPLSFLQEYNLSLKGKEVKQPDMSTQFTKQIQTALQFKDLGDARQYYTDAYFKAYGKFPEADLDKRFQEAWNSEVKKQDQPTTTSGKTEKGFVYDTKSKPVIDKKTGEQKVDKIGQKVFSVRKKNAEGVFLTTSKVTGKSVSKGEGFTSEEQTQFLADFLVNNFPETSWNTEDIGGTAKTIFDTVKNLHTSNYDDAPDLPSVSTFIRDIMSNPDEDVQRELFRQYTDDVTKRANTRFMSLADVMQSGETASKYVNPLLKTLSAGLETEITAKDPIAIKALNFKGEDGKYRLPNDFEISDMISNDSRFGSTSTAINTAVNMAQTLKNALG